MRKIRAFLAIVLAVLTLAVSMPVCGFAEGNTGELPAGEGNVLPVSDAVPAEPQPELPPPVEDETPPADETPPTDETPPEDETSAEEEDSPADEETEAAPAVSEAVLMVQAMIDALPTAEAVQAMDEAAFHEARRQNLAAYGAYMELSAEDQALITGAEIFDALFAIFNAGAAKSTGFTVTIPANVSLNEASGITVTVENLAEGSSLVLSVSSLNGGYLKMGENSISYSFTPSLSFSGNGCQTLPVSVNGADAAGKPAGEYSDVLSFRCSVTETE